MATDDDKDQRSTSRCQSMDPKRSAGQGVDGSGVPFGRRFLSIDLGRESVDGVSRQDKAGGSSWTAAVIETTIRIGGKDQEVARKNAASETPLWIRPLALENRRRTQPQTTKDLVCQISNL